MGKRLRKVAQCGAGFRVDLLGKQAEIIGKRENMIEQALCPRDIAAAGEVIIEGLQAREVPVAQDASAIETTADEQNAPDRPDRKPEDDEPPDGGRRTDVAASIRSS